MNTTDQFADIEDELKPKNKTYPLLLLSYLLFIVCMYGSLFSDLSLRDLRRISLPQLMLMFTFLLLPLTSLILLWFKKKAGWVIGLIFLNLITVIIGNDLIRRFIRKQYGNPFLGMTWATILEIGMFAFALSAICLLLMAEPRKHLSVRARMLTITLIIAGIIDAAIILLMFN